MRARVEAAINSTVPDVRRPAAKARPAPGVVLGEVTALALGGCSLAGDRRVSPKE
ncbi:MAG: hypothetical protein L0H93_05465 [Nocardioides sp.]|nr:hypothetical protein [Nocardioides sp.]